MSASRSRDIFDVLRDRDAAPPAPRATRLARRYQVVYTLADGTRKVSSRVYDRALARKLAARLNRRPHADAYAAPLTVRVEK